MKLNIFLDGSEEEITPQEKAVQLLPTRDFKRGEEGKWGTRKRRKERRKGWRERKENE